MADINGSTLASTPCPATENYFAGNGDAATDVKDIRIAIIGCGTVPAAPRSPIAGRAC
jgi:hypothetical protein